MLSALLCRGILYIELYSQGGVIRTVHKLATVHPYTFNRLTDAVSHSKHMGQLMTDLGEHFKVPTEHTNKMLSEKRQRNPDVTIVQTAGANSRYMPDWKTIYTNGEPWSFLHEYGHAERDNMVRTLQKLLFRNRPALNNDEDELLTKYVVDAYMTGEHGSSPNVVSVKAGDYLLDVLTDLRERKTKDAWRLSEELLNNAKAYNFATIKGSPSTAYNIHQPLSVSDITYAGSFYPDKFHALMQTPQHSEWHPANLLRQRPEFMRGGILDHIEDKLDKLKLGMPHEWEKFRTDEGDI